MASSKVFFPVGSAGGRGTCPILKNTNLSGWFLSIKKYTMPLVLVYGIGHLVALGLISSPLSQPGYVIVAVIKLAGRLRFPYGLTKQSRSEYPASIVFLIAISRLSSGFLWNTSIYCPW